MHLETLQPPDINAVQCIVVGASLPALLESTLTFSLP